MSNARVNSRDLPHHVESVVGFFESPHKKSFLVLHLKVSNPDSCTISDALVNSLQISARSRNSANVFCLY